MKHSNLTLELVNILNQICKNRAVLKCKSTNESQYFLQFGCKGTAYSITQLVFYIYITDRYNHCCIVKCSETMSGLLSFAKSSNIVLADSLTLTDLALSPTFIDVRKEDSK